MTPTQLKIGDKLIVVADGYGTVVKKRETTAYVFVTVMLTTEYGNVETELQIKKTTQVKTQL